MKREFKEKKLLLNTAHLKKMLEINSPLKSTTKKYCILNQLHKINSNRPIEIKSISGKLTLDLSTKSYKMMMKRSIN